MFKQQIYEGVCYLKHIAQPRFNFKDLIDAGENWEPQDTNKDYEINLIQRIARSYVLAIKKKAGIDSVYEEGGAWLTEIERFSEMRRAAINNDVAKLQGLLRGFLRSPLSDGMYQCHMAYKWKPHVVNEMNIWLDDFSVYEELSGHKFDDKPLIGARFGNPICFSKFDQEYLLTDPWHFYQKSLIDRCLVDEDKITVLEIGGGFGGLGSKLLSDGRYNYLDIDLIDQLVLSSYYLGMQFIDKKIMLYEDFLENREDIDHYDAVFLPNFCIQDLKPDAIDVIANFASLSEMDESTVAEYCQQISRIDPQIFVHVNSNVNETRNREHIEITSENFNLGNVLQRVSKRELKSVKMSSGRYVEEFFARSSSDVITVEDLSVVVQ